MKILYYDCFAGISGDMNLSALVDIIGEEQWICEIFEELFKGKIKLSFSNEVRKGMRGKGFNVEEKAMDLKFRYLSDFVELLDRMCISEAVKLKSRRIFEKIAEVESKIHGTSINEIHFHEVGGVDTFVDVVGGLLAIERLKVDKIFSSAIEVGSGFVEFSHGKYPIPAPATAELLKGIPTTQKTSGEATTPTGAAIISSVVESFSYPQQFKVEKIGYGAGGREEGEIPNILRVMYGEIEEKNFILDKNVVIETNLDDMKPETMEYVIEKLFDYGALDVYISPIIMKKSRPAFKINVLCDEENSTKLEEILLKETTTFGIRKYNVEKIMLEREEREVNTSLGKVTVKAGIYKGKKIKEKFEYEDLKRIAFEKGLSINEVMLILSKEIN